MEHYSFARLKVVCNNPLHNNCRKSRSSALQVSVFGPKAALHFLGTWPSLSDMPDAEHRGCAPTVAQIRAYIAASQRTLHSQKSESAALEHIMILLSQFNFKSPLWGPLEGAPNAITSICMHTQATHWVGLHAELIESSARMGQNICLHAGRQGIKAFWIPKKPLKPFWVQRA